MNHQYAGIWKRLAAALVDGMILAAVAMPSCDIAVFVLNLLHFLPPWDGREIPGCWLFARMVGLGLIVVVTCVTVNWLYYAILESSPGQATMGKCLFRIKVTDVNGQRISFFRATARHFGKLLLLLTLGGLLVEVVTDKKQGLHDKIAGCLVISES